MRLIDAEVVKEFFRENLILPYEGHKKIVETMIDAVPTAYDIDKVVEELKVIKEDALAEYNMGEYNLDNNIGNSIAENYRKDMNEGKCFAYDEAIEIVKQGGVSDDVCEWHKVKNGNAYKCNTHAEIHDSRVLDWCKCPYCGKKIKVVE